MIPEHVALRAFNIIIGIMREGSDKDGAKDSWLDKPERFHTNKAMRHVINHDLEGNEPHLHYALVRLAMAICQQEVRPSQQSPCPYCFEPCHCLHTDEHRASPQAPD